jgi:PRC-barrel domain
VNKHLATLIVGTALVTGPALAQTTAPATNAPAPATRSADAKTFPIKQGEWRSSKLIGLNVYNHDDKIGDINELIVDHSGKIEAIVIGVGGFLGMGEHDVAVPFGQVKFIEEPRHTAARTTTNPPAANSTGTVATSPPAAPANTTTRTASTDTYRGYPDHAEVSMTKDQLKALPEVRYSR